MSGSCVIRADGGLHLGYGHIFRTLTLARELLARGWSVHYVCRDLPGAPLERIRDAGIEIALLDAGIGESEDAKKSEEAARDVEASWVIVDRYATDDEAYRLWTAAGLKTLAIDDICEHPFPVDVLLNQNTDAQDLPYQTRPETVRLLGPGYALVRDTYRHARPKEPPTITNVESLMVFMGGSDPDDSTGLVLDALEYIPSRLDVEVITGSAYPHSESLEKAASDSSHRVKLLRNLPDLLGPMQRADVAVVAGGSVTWELCCMGMSVLVMPFANNQEGIARSMVGLGAAVLIQGAALGEQLMASLRDAERMTELGRKAYHLVDGLGVKRVADCMESE